MKNSKRLPRKRLLMFCALPIVPISLWAQTAATDDEGQKTEEDVYVLSPFEVNTSKDVGYIATNSNSGTRLNMAIKDVPLNLEVITTEFLQDTGATNLRDALRYSPGIILQSQNDAFDNSGTGDISTSYTMTTGGGANNPEGVTRSAGDSSTKMRGTEGGYMLQDGFHRVFSADSINIERVEVLRGPSSLLYGSGNVGGVVNFITKKPRFDSETYHVGVTVGNDSFYRAEMDINMPLASEDSSLAKYKPAFRIMSAYEENEDYTDYYNQTHWQTNGAFSFLPTPTTSIVIAAELGNKSEYGNGFQNIRANEGSAGKNAAWLPDLRVWDEETKTVTVTPNPDLDYRTMRWSGPDTYRKGPFRSYSIDVEQKLGEYLFFKAGYLSSRSEFNSRQIITSLVRDGVAGLYSADDPNAAAGSDSYTSIWSDITYTGRGGIFTANPAGSELAGYYTGGVYGNYVDGGTFDNQDQSPTSHYSTTMGYYWQDTEQVNNRDQLRAELVFKYDAGKWGNHTLLTGASYEKIEKEFDVYQPPSTWSETTLDAKGRIVTYHEDGNGSHQVLARDQYSYKSPNDYSPFRFGTQGDGIPDNPMVHWQNIKEDDWNLAYYAAYQGQFFKDRLTFVGGLRWERTDFDKTISSPYANSLIGSTDPYGNSVTVGRQDEVYGGGGANTSYAPQIGLNYEINESLSVFGVYAEGTMPHYWALDGNGEMLDPEESTSYEVGIKFDLLDGKLSGTVSAYHLERENIPYFVWWAPNPIGDIYNGYVDSQPTAMLWTFSTPDAFYDMFAYSGLDYDTTLSTIKKHWGQAWWGAIDEVYKYCVDNNVNADNATDLGQYWNWNAFGPISGDMLNWNFFNRANANTLALVEGAEEYFPLVMVTDDETAALIRTYGISPDWTGNLYVNNNGEQYLYYDPEANTSRIGVNNTRGSNGCMVPMSDEADGWDMTLTFSPIEDFQMTFGFSHLDRKVTSERYRFVSSDEFVLGAQWLIDYGAVNNRPYTDIYGDINDTSTYNLDKDGNLKTRMDMYGHSSDDSPENTATFWMRYNLKHAFGDTPFLKNLAIGFGGQWVDNRLWFPGFLGGGNISTMYDEELDTNVLIEKWTDEQLTLNCMIEYKTTLDEKYDLRVALNIDNLTDDKKAYGNLYASGIKWKLSTTLDF